MKKSIIFGLLLISCMVSAQSVTVTSREVLPLQGAFYPQLDAAGTQLLYTSQNYQGLALYNLNSRTTQQISNEINAGYEPRFANDNQHIYYRRANMVAGRKYTDLLSYNTTSKQKAAILSNLRESISLQNYNQSGMVIATGKKLQKASFERSTEAAPVMACSENLELVVYKNGVRSILNPIKEDIAGYIWVSVSPDKQHILFTAAGSGTYVCDLQGTIVANLGYLNAPVWYGNNYVVGMCDVDDGERITASTIELRSLDGRVKSTLSAPSEIAMNPTTSISSQKVAYNTIRGEIVVLSLSMNR